MYLLFITQNRDFTIISVKQFVHSLVRLPNLTNDNFLFYTTFIKLIDIYKLNVHMKGLR